MLVVLGAFAMSMFSCDVEDLFEQPTIEVTGFTLKELPGEFTHLDIDMLVTNNDSREAFISDVEYTVVIEGYSAEKENVDINQDIFVKTPLELTLPLTLKTIDAIKILAMLDAGEELDYTVTGTFHVDEPVLNLFDLPINIEGTASVDVGFEEFYKQPEVTVNDMSGTYGINGLTSYVFDFDVNCKVENMDSRNVVVDEVEYVVYIEGVKSDTHLYSDSDSYTTDIAIGGGANISLTLPVTLNLGPVDGATLVTALLDETVDYIIEGTFHVIKVDGGTADFLLPLYVTGSVPASMVEL